MVDTTVVISVQRYSFEDEDTGREITGMSLQCLQAASREDADRKGLDVVKLSCDRNLFPEFQAVPGIYELELQVSRGAGGKASVHCVGASLLSTVELLPE